MARRILVAALAPVLACGGSPASPEPAESLKASLEVSPREVSSPQTVRFRLRVTNRGDEEVVVEAGGCPTDSVVTSGDREIWRSSRNRVCILIIQNIRFAAGESRFFGEEWDLLDNEGHRVPPGVYLVRMEFPDRKPPAVISPPVSLTVR